MDNQELYYVWSIEHEGWWPQNRCGYMRSIQFAGKFTFEEAKEIVEDANKIDVRMPNGLLAVKECMIPVNLVKMDETMIRGYLWMNHGVGCAPYGDDGEMQCCGLDFKRTEINELISQIYAMRSRVRIRERKKVTEGNGEGR